MTTSDPGGTDRGRTEHGGVEPVDTASLVRRSRPIRWLIAGGVLLVAAIAIGTAVTIGSFRGRALANHERELESTVQLLARHFDQQLHQLELAESGVIEQMRSAGIDSRERV